MSIRSFFVVEVDTDKKDGTVAKERVESTPSARTSVAMERPLKKTRHAVTGIPATASASPSQHNITAIAAANAGRFMQHGPSMSDHQEEKVRVSGYYEMRNHKLSEAGASLRRSDPSSHSAVYRNVSRGLHAKCSTSLERDDPAGTSNGPNTEYSAPQFLRGVVAYINGYTSTISAMHLTKLIQLHGGECSISFGKKKVTHVICENLSGQKMDKVLNAGARAKLVSVVKPAWVTESIRAGKRLEEGLYFTLKDDAAGRVDTFFTRQT